MKSFITFLFAAALIAGFGSCEKVENKVKFEGGTAPVLSASVSAGSEVPLDSKNKDGIALTLNWTNPDYMFNTGVSAQDVTYVLQVDKAGANFSSSSLQEKSISRETESTITSGDLNKMLIQLGFPFDEVATFEVRVKSYLGDGSVPLYSNVLTYKATPFLDVVVPVPPSGELYIVGGDAQLGGWQNGGAFASQNQKFTQVDLTTYTITINLSGGDNSQDSNQFLIIPVWGDWSHKYACQATDAQSETGGTFGYDWPGNFPGPSAAGQYKIDVDFVLGKYTVTKL